MGRSTFSGPVVSENGFIFGASGTQITQTVVYTPTLDVLAVAATTVADQTFTVTGLTTADKVIVNPPALPAGLTVSHASVSAADTLLVRFHNTTAAIVDPAAAVWNIVAIRS